MQSSLTLNPKHHLKGLTINQGMQKMINVCQLISTTKFFQPENSMK